MEVSAYSDQVLLGETIKMVKQERTYSFKVLCHLLEIYERRLYRDFNYNSLFEFCRHELGHTAGEAQYRVAAVKLMVQSPRIIEAIENRQLPLSNAVLLQNYIAAKRIKEPSRIEALAMRILGKSKTEVKAILWNDGKKKRAKTRKKPRIEVDYEILNLLKELQSLSLRGEKVCLKEALKAEIKRQKERRNKQLQKPSANQKRKTRYIPESEKAKVITRAGRRCEYVNREGQRCENTKNLQFDHNGIPFAVGGKNTAENLKLLCQGHNLRGAIKYFGKEKIKHEIFNRNAGITPTSEISNEEDLKH